MPSVWQVKGLRAVHYRILFWFLDAGIIGKNVRRGWQAECSKDLGIHRITLRANIKRLSAMGIMREGKKRGEVILVPSIFECKVDREKLKLEDE